MRKALLTFFFLIVAYGLIEAQNHHKIQYRADVGLYDEDFLPGAQRLIGNVAFAQDNIKGYCDSAYLYDKENYIIAFGDRVRIYIGDSVQLYGRRAYYDGNMKIASIASKVKLEKGRSYLLTDSLTYDLNIDLAYYLTGGQIFSDEDTLTSVRGKYYTKTDDAFVEQDVVLFSKTYKMVCDTLQYNTSSKTAYFVSPTHLTSDQDSSEIFTDLGWYDTQNDRSTLHGNVQLYNNKGQTLFADSAYYDKHAHFGKAWRHVKIIDTAKNYILQGNYIEHHENGGISVATDSNLLILIDENSDSLYLHSDTLKIFFNEDNEIIWANAYNRVKFYRSDLQGACDSLSYIAEDSLITMFYNPATWAEEYQLTADTIKFTLLDSTNTRIDLCKAGFIVGGLFNNSEFNQIKGTKITGYIVEKELCRVDIVGNAECIYYIQEEDSSLIGINTSITSDMRILLRDNKISQIRFYDHPDGKIYPDEHFEDKNRRLTDFRWLEEYHPHNPGELYVKPIPRYKTEYIDK